MSDPMEPARKLMEAFGKQVEALGLTLHTFAILPNPEGAPHSVQAMLTFDGSDLEEVLGKVDDAPLSLDEKDAFDMLARDMERTDADEKADAAAESLRKMQEDLEKNRGILGDD